VTLKGPSAISDSRQDERRGQPLTIVRAMADRPEQVLVESLISAIREEDKSLGFQYFTM